MPHKSQKNAAETSAPVRSPWGVFTLFASEQGVTRLEFPGEAGKAGSVKPSPAQARILALAKAKLENYFSGKKENFSGLKFDLGKLTDFEQSVLRTLSKLESKESVSYSALASLAGKPRAARAVGGAMRKNPLPVLIPCHRVFAAGGGLGGYSKGLDWKRRLLKLENFVIPAK